MVGTMSDPISQHHPAYISGGETQTLPCRRRHPVSCRVARSQTIDFSSLACQGAVQADAAREEFRKQRSISVGNGYHPDHSYGMHSIVEEEENKLSRKGSDGIFYHARPALAGYDCEIPRAWDQDKRDIPPPEFGSRDSFNSEPDDVNGVQTPRKFVLMRSASETKAWPDRTLPRRYHIGPRSLFYMPLNGSLSKSCVELLREPKREPAPRNIPYERQSSTEEASGSSETDYFAGYQNSILNSSNSSDGYNCKVPKYRNGSCGSDSSEDLLGSSRGSTTSGSNTHPENPRLQRLVDTLGLAFNAPRKTDSRTDVCPSKNDFYSSDEDADDYGFLSHDLFANTLYSSVMHKAKSPSATRRIIPKKWRSKTKLTKSVWTPEGDSTWAHQSGKKVVLANTTLLNLCEVERLALQKLAVARLQALSLGCSITVPKDGSPTKRHKRTAFSLKRVRSNSGNLTGLLDNLKAKEKEAKEQPHGLVFGIPLTRCLANDLDHRRRRSFMLKERTESRGYCNKNKSAGRKSSSSSVSSADNHSQHLDPSDREHMYSCSSLHGSDLCHSETSASTSLIDALSLHSTSTMSSHRESKSSPLDNRKSLLPSVPQVPSIVNTCCKHIETYGLHTLGIFRIGSSKKRIKQLREEFDNGKEVKLNEDHNPHDVGALLKEFYRDLPEPLLTRELYSAFIATRKLKESSHRITALQLLVALLPVANRDTLWSLLKFLHKVAQHSTDITDEQGQVLPGNKMDAHNLATLFGPNILHKVKGGAGQEFHVESMERAEERREIIEVIKDMINYNTKLYEVPSDLHDEVLKMLADSNPDALDYLLKRKCDDLQITIEIDPDTSSSVFDESDSSPPGTVSPSRKREGRIRTLSDAISLIHHHKPVRATCSDAQAQVQARQRDYLTVPSRNSYRRSMPDPKMLASQTYQPDSPPIRVRSASEKAPSNKTGSQTNIARTNSSPVVLRRQQRKQPDLKIETTTKDQEESSSSSGYTSRSPYGSTSSTASCNPASPTRKTSSPTSPAHKTTYQPPSPTRTCSLPGNQRWSLAAPPSGYTATPQLPHAQDVKPPTSSTQRPLGLFVAGPNVGKENPRETGGGPPKDWQKDRWRHWENTSPKRQQPEKSIEQETLV